MRDTKQVILDKALTLFSERGYGTVSVEQIAQAVGIKAPSLYKHYKSKQEIFDAIIGEMEARYKVQAAAMQMNGSDPAADVGVFADVSEEQLVQMGKGLFLYFLHDDYTCRFRKLLTIAQYHDAELAAHYTRQYGDAPLAYQGMLFGMLSRLGAFRPADEEVMALHFYAPLYFLLTLCDRQPEREEEALVLLERHIRQFNAVYRKDTT